MITRSELQQYGPSLKYTLGQLEKDFLQHHFLSILYANSSTEFIFKGGTALQKSLGLDRFSEDLDFNFSQTPDSVLVIEKTFDRVIRQIRQLFSIISIKFQQQDHSINCKLHIEGPLFSGKPISMCSLKIDISLRESTLLTPIVQKILPIYQPLRPYTVYLMQPEEILAEKVRAIMSRNKARDMYDCWFLLKKKIPWDFNLINQKLTFYGMVFTTENLEKHLFMRKKIWIPELRPIIKTLPAFNDVCDSILRKVENE